MLITEFQTSVINHTIFYRLSEILIGFVISTLTKGIHKVQLQIIPLYKPSLDKSVVIIYDTVHKCVVIF